MSGRIGGIADAIGATNTATAAASERVTETGIADQATFQGGGTFVLSGAGTSATVNGANVVAWMSTPASPCLMPLPP